MNALTLTWGVLLCCLVVLPSGGTVLDIQSGAFPGAVRYRFIPYAHEKTAVTFDGVAISDAEIMEPLRRVSVPDFMGRGAAHLSFDGGKLIAVSRPSATKEISAADANELSLPPEQWGTRPGSLRLWRKHSSTDQGAWNYWNRSNRLRLWFPNPNGAGALLAEILLICLSILFLVRRRKVLTILIGLGALLSLYALLGTASRGSMVALLAGTLVFGIGLLARKFSIRRALLFLGLLCVVAIALSFGVLGSRFGQNLFQLDAGNVERLNAWRAAPGLLASAWGGWGERCGIGYCDWFQPMNDFHPLVYLIGTHLTWMVSHGVMFSFFYIWLWLLTCGTLLVYARRSLWALCGLSMATLFFIANAFSTLGQYASLWVLPMLTLLLAVRDVLRVGRSSVRRLLIVLLGSMLLSGACLASVLLKGARDLANLELPVHREGQVTLVGKGDPTVWIVADDWVLTHFTIGSLGRDVRSWFAKHPESGTLAIVESLDQLPAEVNRLALVGKSAVEFRKRLRNKESRAHLPSFRHLVFISPPVPVGLLSPIFYERTHAEVWLGTLSADCGSVEGEQATWLHLVPGAELYLPNWVAIAFGKEHP